MGRVLKHVAVTAVLLLALIVLLCIPGCCCVTQTERRPVISPLPWDSQSFSTGLEDSVRTANQAQTSYRFLADEERDWRDNLRLPRWRVRVQDGKSVILSWWARGEEPFLLLEGNRILRVEHESGNVPEGAGPTVVAVSLPTGKESWRVELPGPPPFRGVLSLYNDLCRIKWLVEAHVVELRTGPQLAWIWTLDARDGSVLSGPIRTRWDWD